ncbi:PREDICTED: transmembrane protein 160-like isoform X1 [Amphimedon queenslandica]|uniref:Uncharacterized protein n=1 Tax=Amphimedon queenslandica TaxID=400682 RepID=A0AAN0J3I9_AMPQE|nr:PREDICTED: transmembrane protein 160-like isoform X1 [Amphimedon queenslandica]|eukprot:XP_019851585.1 PREDICTED: transmembrane protein 160-like isoform X1 [Amphimedon queenslandica]
MGVAASSIIKMAARGILILRYSRPWQLWQQNCLLKRRFFTRFLSSNQNETTERSSKDDEENTNRLMLRYSQENGFLSWSRNAAICAGVGATLSMIEKTSSFSYLSSGFFDLGLIFMTVGSFHHILSSIYLRKHFKLSLAGLCWNITYSSIIWIGYISLVWQLI